ECMVPFTGRSKETTLVKGKPTPVGFKIWVIAQQGYFLQWLWHVKGSPVTPVTVKLEVPTPYGKKGKLRTEIPLSNTQSVVVHLLKRLSTLTHHVSTDNLFSLPQLFRLLRQLGYGATGTARPNCGITTVMKQIEETGKLPNGKPWLFNKLCSALPFNYAQRNPSYPHTKREEVTRQKRHEGRVTTPKGGL
ncbi:hypothetical protein BFJ63_vAg19297, partial [Fusarium oxysporum f. sp. narcissi]